MDIFSKNRKHFPKIGIVIFVVPDTLGPIGSVNFDVNPASRTTLYIYELSLAK